MELTSWGRLGSCTISNEELTGHISISSWTDFELSVDRPIHAFCQQHFEINYKVEDHM